MSVALHDGPMDEAALRPPHPDLVNLCRELQGGPVADMTMPVTQRIAAVWRGPGTWEERLLATMRQAQAEGPTVWVDLTSAVAQQAEIEEFLRKRHAAAAMLRYSTASSMVIARKRLAADCKLLEEAMGVVAPKRTPLPAWWSKFRPLARK